jgi:portal protein
MARRKQSKSDEEIVREAQERFDRALEYQADAHRHYIADMQFANGDDYNGYQWSDDVSGARRQQKRPALTVNKTRVHCLQVINDARQNPVQVRVNPVGGEATYEAAQIYEGIIRHIEYVSNAQSAYANATYCQVMGGIGYWRVLLDYVHDESFDQDIYIRRIADPTQVYMDPDIQQADGSDARWAFLFYELSRDEFEEEYGDDEDDEENLNNAALTTSGARHTDDKHVQLAEYYRVGQKNDRLLEMPDGQVVRESDLPPGALEQLKEQGIEPRGSRDIAVPEVEWFLLADNRIIDRKDWPGIYIPIVRVPCEEIIIDGKMDWVSHVRHLRDPQRLYNWYTSQAAEFVALQTKAPFIATAESIEHHLNDWEHANEENKAVLLYKGTDERGQPIQPPHRAQPPVMAQAYMEGLKISQAEMMMATGQYQAVMGEPGNETSGKAINARQRQGDNATYHVIDRLASAIRYTGRIILDLIPKVYNSERALLLMGEDGTQTQVHVDPTAPVAHQTTVDPNLPPPQPSMNAQDDPDEKRAQALRTIFNPNVGRYAVVADVGPAYATKRQEAFNAFSQVIAQNQAAFTVVGDFWARNADFPGADELAARLKQGLPPQYKAGAPNPETMQLQQALEQQGQHAQQLLQKADAEIAGLKAQLVHAQEQAKDKGVELQIDEYKAETDRLKAVGTIDPLALQVVVRQLVREMLDTDLPGSVAHHGDMEMALQSNVQAAAPPEPPQTNGAAAPGE